MNDTQNIPDPDLLFASDNEKTFSSDESLPSLPVPDLQHTLQRYLDSGAYILLFLILVLECASEKGKKCHSINHSNSTFLKFGLIKKNSALR